MPSCDDGAGGGIANRHLQNKFHDETISVYFNFVLDHLREHDNLLFGQGVGTD
jgi:hypothetical protein